MAAATSCAGMRRGNARMHRAPAPPFGWKGILAAIVLVANGTGISHAATTVQLPNWVCAHPDAVFVDGFQPAQAITRLPSSGTGGSYPGSLSRDVIVPGMGTRTYHLRIPPAYAPDRPLPLVFALHGQAGSPAAAATAAQSVRTTWSSIADSGQFIVVAPVASGSGGSWIVPPPGPSDYDTFAAVIADVEAAYNIDRSRRIGWGFSAGGHVMHDLILNDYSAQVTIDTFAAYAVSAGVLAGLTCNSTASCNAAVGGASRHIPLDIHIGSTDPLLAQASSDRARFLNFGWNENTSLWYTQFSGGHVYSATHFAEIWTHLCPFQVLP